MRDQGQPRVEITANGDIALITPYHGEIISFCKRYMGKWREVLLADGTTTKAWVLSARHRERAEAKIYDVFPPDNVLQLTICLWDSRGNWSKGLPYLDGSSVCIGGLDYMKQPWISNIRHPAGERVFLNTLQAGKTADGSFVVRGMLIITARIRPKADIYWPGLNGKSVRCELRPVGGKKDGRRRGPTVGMHEGDRARRRSLHGEHPGRSI